MAGFLNDKELLMKFKVNAAGDGLENDVTVLTKNNTDPFEHGELDKIVGQTAGTVANIASNLVDPAKRDPYIANSVTVPPAAIITKISGLTTGGQSLMGKTKNTAAPVELETGMEIPPNTDFTITLTAAAAAGDNTYKIDYEVDDGSSTGTTVPKTVDLTISQADLIAKFNGKTTDTDVHSGGKRARRKSSKRKSAKHKRGGRRGRRKSNKHRR